MRCVIYRLSDKQESIIRKYHRNRGVGVAEYFTLPQGKCFISIQKPPFLKMNVEDNLPGKIIYLSAIYVAPIVTSKENLNDFKKFSVKEIRASNYNLREFLRHLRISEYSMIDFYLSKNDKQIEDFIRKDIKRFWRILDEDNGIVIGHYLFIDNLFSIVLSMP